MTPDAHPEENIRSLSPYEERVLCLIMDALMRGFERQEGPTVGYGVGRNSEKAKRK